MFKKENLRKNFLRVKQIADQNLGRAEKSEVLSDDLQFAEKRVENVKHVCQTTLKKVSSNLQGTGTDVEKRLKKLPEAVVGHSMIESAGIIGAEFIMGQMFQMCGECQSNLAKEHLQCEIDIEKTVLGPLQDILEDEIPNINKLKKQLNKVTLDMDSAKGRWNNAVRQTQVPGANMASASAKADNIREELEEASNRVEQAKDALTTGMFHFISKETDHSQNLLALLEAQAAYHRNSLEIIEKVIPKMKEALTCNPNKPVYGVSLEEHLRVTNRDIAVVLEDCICFLLESGLEEEGLFRIAGMASKVKKLKSSFDAGIDFEDNGDVDPHTVAGALKQYLRELPEPLLTYDLYSDFMSAAQSPQEQKLQAIWCVVDRLPKPNYNNFRYLVKFLSKLAEKSEVNKMSPSNIAIVIGPNLLWSEGDSGPNMMTTGILSSVIELIVQHADWFFPGEVKFSCSSSSTESSPVIAKGAHDQLDRTGSNHQEVERSSSNQSVGSDKTSNSSQGTPDVSQHIYQEIDSPSPGKQPSRSPSISPVSSTNNLYPALSGAPLAESEDFNPPAGAISRRQTRKPAPPPPPGRPFSVAVTASIKSNPGSQTWPRQVPGPSDTGPAQQTTSEKLKTLPPEKPPPPERVSSLTKDSSTGHSLSLGAVDRPEHRAQPERPKVPPPVVPPTHKRSASTGTPIAGPPLEGSENATPMASDQEMNKTDTL